MMLSGRWPGNVKIELTETGVVIHFFKNLIFQFQNSIFGGNGSAAVEAPYQIGKQLAKSSRHSKNIIIGGAPIY